MAKKTGLGKGLDALFGSDLIKEEINEVIEDKSQKIQKIKITEIEPNRNQPRKKFDEVAGERRWRASKKAGLKEIPVIVREDDEKTNKEIALIENIQREDLNPIEKAMGIRSLMDDYGLTQQKVSEILGKARSSIANSVRILNLDERVIKLALEGKLTEGHCKSLLTIDDKDKQYEMAIYLIESGDSVREAEKKLARNKNVKKSNKKYEAIYRDIESSFQDFFGTKVKLDVGKRKGKIIIQYANNEDLERILELIKK